MSQVIKDMMDPERARALAVALDLEALEPKDLPPFFHQAYFWHPLPQADLGRDGHPALGRAGLIPDLGLPRRMWAGGRLVFQAPLNAGEDAEKRSSLEGSALKQGRSGPLAFVTLRHEIWQGGTLKLTEWQDLVYRPDPDPKAPAPAQSAAPQDRAPEEHRFSTTLLFRYSALTFNGHRIHYDLDYARGVEGYPGLVVHGPLLAQLLMLRARRELGPLATFGFRAVAPLFHFESAVSCRDGGRFWFRGPDGRLCLEAEAAPL
jgi:3-methylfumaryl-CoA hydratase